MSEQTHMSQAHSGSQKKNGRGVSSARLAVLALLHSRAVIPRFLKVAFQKFSWNALLVFNLRAAVALIFRILTIARSRPRDLLSLSKVVSEDALRFRIEAVRLGLFIGAFSGVYSFFRSFLGFLHHRMGTLRALSQASPVHAGAASSEKKVSLPPLDTSVGALAPIWATFAAAGIAGSSFAILGKDGGNRSIALYTGARALECTFKLLCHFNFLSISTVADSPTGWASALYVFFAMSTGQVMYAYVMRPETLPPSYWNFIVKMGPIAKPVLSAVRESCRGIPVNVEALSSALDKLGYDAAQDIAAGGTVLAGPPRLIPMISSGVLHPRFKSPVVAVLDCLKNTFSRSFPVYLSLSLGPSLVLRFKRFLRDPFHVVLRAFTGASRSALFLGALCSMYYAFVLTYRAAGIPRTDSRFMYYWAGWFASLSIFIEKESRRTELLLYVIPRAIDSLCQIIVDRNIMPSIPGLDMALFCASMGTIVTCFEHFPSTVNPWVQAIGKRLLAKDVLKSASPTPTPTPGRLTNSGPGDHESVSTFESRVERLMTTIKEDEFGAASTAMEEDDQRILRQSSSEPHWLDSGISQLSN